MQGQRHRLVRTVPAVVVATLMVVGCEEQGIRTEAAPAAPAPVAAAPATTAPQPTRRTVVEGSGSTLGGAKRSAENLNDRIGDQQQDLLDQIDDMNKNGP